MSLGMPLTIVWVSALQSLFVPNIYSFSKLIPDISLPSEGMGTVMSCGDFLFIYCCCKTNVTV